MRAVRLSAVLVVAALVLGLASPVVALIEPSTPVATASPVLTDLALHGTSGMQSFAYDSSDKSWVFAQVMDANRVPGSSSRPSQLGDLTLTRVSSSGRVLGHMYLLGFGHGVSLAVEPVGGTAYLWTEAVSSVKPNRDSTFHDAFGTKIARFAWANSSTIRPTSPGVELFGDNAGTFMQTPSLDLRDGLIAVEYWNPSSAPSRYRYAVYRLSDFKRHHYRALYRVTEPAVAARGLLQGWALTGPTSITVYSGNAYSLRNPPPGNVKVFTFDEDALVRSAKVVSAGTALKYREPEGIAIMSGRLCYGFAWVRGNAHRANVYCSGTAAAPLVE